MGRWTEGTAGLSQQVVFDWRCVDGRNHPGRLLLRMGKTPSSWRQTR